MKITVVLALVVLGSVCYASDPPDPEMMKQLQSLLDQMDDTDSEPNTKNKADTPATGSSKPDTVPESKDDEETKTASKPVVATPAEPQTEIKNNETATQSAGTVGQKILESLNRLEDTVQEILTVLKDKGADSDSEDSDDSHPGGFLSGMKQIFGQKETIETTTPQATEDSSGSDDSGETNKSSKKLTWGKLRSLLKNIGKKADQEEDGAAETAKDSR